MGTQLTDYLVIGKGLIGSAAARYLGITGKNVVLIGPDEPDDWNAHSGAFSSHYDQSRIIRIHDPDPVWGVLALRSIAQYQTLENESGIPFYIATCGLRVGRDSTHWTGSRPKTDAAYAHVVSEFEAHDEQGLRNTFPYLRFPDGFSGFTERKSAGYINPRALLRAQVRLAEIAGVDIVSAQVDTVEKKTGGIEIKTTDDQIYMARRVLIAAGAYSNTLLTRQLDLIPKKRTVVLAKLTVEEVARLREMPTIIYQRPFDPSLTSVYILPPVQYPDGNFYIKIGGDNEPANEAHTADALQAWFRSGGSVADAAALKTALLSVIPRLSATSFHQRPCVVTYTSTKRPFIDQVDDGLYVATGGCGSAAKSSNEIGRLAAELVHNGEWEEKELGAGTFHACWS